jgi:hypothetical protein
LSDKSTFTFDKLTDTLSVPYIISTAITATDFYGGTFHGSVSGAASKANTLLYNYDSLGTNYVSATDAATGNTIVARDSLGNFSAGTMTGTATRAQYADLAENYLPDALYAPGTVLIFGGDCEVTVSTTPLDTRVAGVVSTNPAHLMNGALTDGVAVALQGRVPCQVVGTIRKGDMLVTSDIPGVATSTATPQLGTIIGKALEDYNSQEVGTIEVVVGRV